MTAKTPYWLTPDEKPEDALFAELGEGIDDLYGSANVSVTGSSNGDYDGAWVRMRGTFHLADGAKSVLHTKGSAEWGTSDDFLCEGSIAANMSKAELIRLRNALDMLIETMDFRKASERQAFEAQTSVASD
jgi:hypothetical protein